MGCVQAKCWLRCRRCCCRCQLSSAGSDGAASRDGDPGHGRHIISGSPVGSAAVPSHRLLLQFSSLSQRGHYPDTPDRENQDTFCIKTQLQGNPNLHLFAVFDGHGYFGAQCAAFARDHLVEDLAGDPHLLEDPVKSFNSAFLSTNSELHNSEIDDTMSGTTAIAVLVGGDTLFVANVGDSRAVAGVWDGERVVAEDLSSDQTPFREDEYERVRRCGARVLSVDQVEGIKDPAIQSWGMESEGDPPRLWVQNGMYPGTAFTRSVGDSTAESIGVVAVPEVMTVRITPSHLFFVVASDGVFEFLSSQAVVDMVSRYPDPRDACSAIAAESYKLWLEHEIRTDDITIIVVHIRDLCGSDAVATNEASHAGTKASLMVSQKARTDISASPGPETGHPKRRNFLELQSCPSDFSLERSLACVAPSPTHSLSIEK
ncbi:probable protein phosphatase 2C 35 [Phoenix dactylifera]|uniref:protein-serine/threonine phosphatase n=1 Tax=Phoenix dactylifera TaxID=42345 RepID=A0A8B7BFQ4_PHODC|nr:probable protein phosphatase 2C 35 [Phoenix dactylifera]XP_008775720.1 probable protein phosphatase 2C 35 [Phoenix dactylifera]XP_038977960.1 probable protein phosphatase 2C 35 [Phoenix dactylifera]XP_038977961.1 probable protein phosphatase 2C 35 [Phoenix dactylifera]